MSNWAILKEANGETYALIVGHPGVPGTVEVEGLSLTYKQGEQLGNALIELERRAGHNTLAAVRKSLGIK